MNKSIPTVGIVFVLLFLGGEASGQLWDQGFNSPVIRSDYPDPITGTATSPLSIDSTCLWGGACVQHSGIFEQSNWWELGNAGTEDLHYVAHFNLEPAFFPSGPTAHGSSCSGQSAPFPYGPPAQSLPMGLPGSDIFGFTTENQSDPGNWRMHFVLRLDLTKPLFSTCQPSFPDAIEGAPYAHYNIFNEWTYDTSDIGWTGLWISYQGMETF